MRYGFFDSTITGYDEEGQPVFDRSEDAEFFSAFFEAMLTDGIYSSPADGFAVTPGTGMQVSVSAGRCLIRGRFGWLEEGETVNLSASSSSRARIDRIVIRMSLSDRNITVAALTGTPSTTPVAPSLTRDLSHGVWELGIADVLVPAASTSVSAVNITDQRTSASLCGFVSALGTLSAQTVSVTLLASDWSGSTAPFSCVKSVAGVLPNSHLIVSGADGSMDRWIDCGVYCASQSLGTVTFRAAFLKPDSDITANVMIV